MSWWKDLKIKIGQRRPLKRHTSFRIGGPARFFCEPKDASELKLLINRAKRYNISVLVIGSGSNILAADAGVEALVIRLSAAFFRKISIRNGIIESGSGVTLGALLMRAARRGFSGAEFLAGIPGTVGGALAMNAGITAEDRRQKTEIRAIGDLAESVTVMDRNGRIKKLEKKDLRFSYRKSNLGKFIVLNARFKLKKQNKRLIRNRISGYLDLRKDKLDLSHPSAGCIWRNPPHDSAGRLIDACGLKGKKIGGACVSRKHANFILNRNNAGSGDVLKLMALIRKKVKNKFNLILEPEIKIWK